MNLNNLSKSLGSVVCDWRVRAATLAALGGVVVSTSILAIEQGQSTYIGLIFTLIACLMACACVFVKKKTSGVASTLFCLASTTMIAILATSGDGFIQLEEVLKGFDGDGVFEGARVWLLHTSLCAVAIKTAQTAICRF